MGGPAQAHQSSTVYGEVEVRGRAVHLTIQIADGDLYEALGLERDRPATEQEALSGSDRVAAYVAARIRLDNQGLPCAARPVEGTIAPRSGGFFYVQRLRYSCPRSIEDAVLTYNLFFDLDPRHQALLHVRAFGSEAEQVLRASARTLKLRGALTRWDHARDYLVLGIEHIFTGYDHVAFLFGLLLLAGGLRREIGPTARRLSSHPLGHLLGVVTSFTIAHSVTLLMAALGWVALPARAVEAVIALSIGYVAAENLLRPQPQHRFLLTFGFGLVHGFGFASVLREIGLPKQGLLLSLFSFNLGVELGQLLVVALVFPILHLLAHRGPSQARLRLQEVLGVAVLCTVALGLFSQFDLPWMHLLVLAGAVPALLLYLVPRYGYDRCVRRGGSMVILLLSMLWLVERVLDRPLLGGILG